MQVSVLCSFKMSLNARNGQRPGAVAGMKLSEVDARRVAEVDGSRVITIKVSEHKTGRAAISFCGETITQFDQWVVVRRKLPFKDSCPYVFPSVKGTKLTQIVQKVAGSLNLSLPTSQRIRSNIEIRAATLDTPTQALIARHLSHSKVTAEKSYRALQATDRATAFQAVGNVMGVTPSSSSSSTKPSASKKGKRKFTEEEEKVLKVYFKEYIDKKTAPKKEAIMPIFSTHPEFCDRTYKDIYDKIRNFFRYK